MKELLEAANQVLGKKTLREWLIELKIKMQPLVVGMLDKDELDDTYSYHEADRMPGVALMRFNHFCEKQGEVFAKRLSDTYVQLKRNRRFLTIQSNTTDYSYTGLMVDKNTAYDRTGRVRKVSSIIQEALFEYHSYSRFPLESLSIDTMDSKTTSELFKTDMNKTNVVSNTKSFFRKFSTAH